MAVRRYLDLSGYGFSGKQAVIDLMREFQGYHVEEAGFEFCLLRVQGGIHDLEEALVTNWSPVRSDAAVRRFRRLVRHLGPRNRLLDPRSWFTATGQNYDERYAGRFTPLSEEYADRLVASSFVADWPYPLFELNDVELFSRKLLRRAGFRRALDFEVVLSRPEDFVALTREYLDALLSSNVAADVHTVVLHNAFEPYHPERSLPFFEDARCIVVDRDPRDIYVQQLSWRPMAVGPEDFVTRFRMMRGGAAEVDDPRVLRLRFEELVLDYERVLPVVMNFLGEEPSRHVAPRRHFDPERSARNIGLWRAHPRQDEIRYVAGELAEYCGEVRIDA